jgi:UDP:flavonoid glycosyltransferase YjiC (YdhE family)
VMPEVERLTRAVRLPWFCERATLPTTRAWPIRNVLLLGGATDAVAPALRDLIRVLHAGTAATLFAPQRLLPEELRGSPRVRPFGFGDTDFATCDLVIGRPGVGLLTDCVRFALPILCFGDEANAEMRHNALRVEELGIGRRVQLGEAAATAQLLRGGITHPEYRAWCENLASRKCGGIAGAARFISRKLDLPDDETQH